MSSEYYGACGWQISLEDVEKLFPEETKRLTEALKPASFFDFARSDYYGENLDTSEYGTDTHWLKEIDEAFGALLRVAREEYGIELETGYVDPDNIGRYNRDDLARNFFFVHEARTFTEKAYPISKYIGLVTWVEYG